MVSDLEFDQQYDFSTEEIKALDELLALPELDLKKLEQLKRKVAKKHHLARFLSNSQIIKRARDRNLFEAQHPWIHRLNRKPTRSISGVSIVAVMIPPDLGGIRGSCPFNCSYCPTADNAPKSYLGHEPSTLRAIGYGYNPYKIVEGRMKQLELIGHPVNKIQLIIQGGTFNAVNFNIQDEVLKDCFDAILGQSTNNIEQALMELEYSERRLIGLTYETRPDFCKPNHIDRMLNRAGTMIEIGVQNLSDRVLQIVNRGHDVAEIYKAVKNAKDAGFKVTLHMMPNLYATPQQDIEMFEELFSNSDLKPDGLKIYPLLVIPGTEIYKEWKAGNFEPYSDAELINALANIKRDLPEYTRIHRIQRDIPIKYVEGGLLIGNLRNTVKEVMERRGWNCSCIRCREVGHVRNLTGYQPPNKEQLQLEIYEYEASGGKECFLSVVDPATRVLFGFLRMRFPSSTAHRPEITTETAIIRELHVYGTELEIGSDPLDYHSQHRGWGKKLMQEAETIAKEYGYTEMLVISGIGVREYYKKIGYYQKGPYVAKNLL